MTLAELQNGIRVLYSIDMWELEQAGIIKPGDTRTWLAFCNDPCRWLIRADDGKAGKLWGIVERRTKK